MPAGIVMLLRATLCMMAWLYLTPASVLAQGTVAGYPNKPIRILVPFAPGGGADLMARIITPRLMERAGQTVVVDNRLAASGIVAIELT